MCDREGAGDLWPHATNMWTRNEPLWCLSGKLQRRLKRRTSGITVTALLTHSAANSEPIRGGTGRQSSTCYFLRNSLWVFLLSSSLQPFPKATPPPSITGSRRRRSTSPITALTFYFCARKNPQSSPNGFFVPRPLRPDKCK